MKPVSETAFYCCGARMLDAQSHHPIANDTLASVFMADGGKAIFHQFRREKIANTSCVVRHHLIDIGILNFLEQHPDGTVILLGAGFDTRAFRFRQGHWIELDEHALIDYKEKRLPASDCPNPLQRFGIDFSTDELDKCLTKLSDKQPVLFVIEGVSMYLDNAQMTALLETLNKHFTEHQIICDLLKQRFQRWFGRSIQRKIQSMGNRFSSSAEPETLFTRRGYRQVSYQSIIAHTFETGALPIPRKLARHLPSLVRNGYGIYLFESGTA